MLPLILGLAAGACIPNEDPDPVGGSCNIAADQQGSFMAKVANLPLKVVVDGSFDPDQKQKISEAVFEWNSFGQRTLGHDFFEITSGAIPEFARSGDPRDCQNGDLPADTVPLVRETSHTHWLGLGFSDEIPAATIRCSSGGDVNRQVILVNTQVADSRQLMSFVLHELGHALGLDHSCTQQKGRTDFRNCGGLAESDSYHLAVMYPVLRVHFQGEQPEVKEALRTNDKERAGCLYHPQ